MPRPNSVLVHEPGSDCCEPAPAGTQFTIPVTAVGRLSTPEEFGNIILRASADGSVLAYTTRTGATANPSRNPRPNGVRAMPGSVSIARIGSPNVPGTQPTSVPPLPPPVTVR